MTAPVYTPYVAAPAASPYLVAPAAASPVMAQSTVAIESQAAAVAATSVAAQDAAVAYLLASGLTDEEAWYDHLAITDMARGVAGVVDAFSETVARQMDAFIADSIENLSGKKYRAIGLRDTIGVNAENGVREGVTTAGVFGRAADTYRYQRSLLDKQFIADVAANAPTPTELASPLNVATDRIRRGAQLNLALAGRNQARATMADAAKRDLITGYRRVLHAELSHQGSCGLCVAASTQVYRADHLMPLHPGCHCVPVPVSAKHDPGGAINDRDLARFYDEAGGTSAEKLRATRYKVDEHGEIGPVLRPHGDPIRTEQQAAADTNRRRPKSVAQQVATLRNRRDQLARALAKMPQTDPAWHQKADEVHARIGRLESQIIRLEGRH